MNKKVIALTALLAFFIIAILTVSKIKQFSDAYVFGYPLVLMDLTRKAQLAELQDSPDDVDKTNHFTHRQSFPDHQFRNVVRPNNDTLYSIAWLDLATEPIVLSVPNMHGRYYVMPLMDAWTNVNATVGKRLSGTDAGDFLISGPNWAGDVPTGLVQLVANTNMNWLIGRIQTNGSADIPAVKALQEKFHLTPLSQWGARNANKNYFRNADPTKQTNYPGEQLEQMSGVDFFAYLAELMRQQPPAENDAEMLKTLQRLGLDSATKPGFLSRRITNFAVEKTKSGIRNALDNRKANENGWNVLRNTIGEYGTNYRLRAAVAMIGLGAVPASEASYPNTSLDSQGQVLTGEHRYRIRFPTDQTPPANAFWSIALYDTNGFFIKNTINRYSIGDRNNLHANNDGSIDILIQHERPADSNVNWLPSPANEFELTMRIYHPKQSFLDGEWRLPAVERVD